MALALLLPLLGTGTTPATRAAEVTIRWTPPSPGDERATAYRVRISSLERRDIEFAEIDSPTASGLTLTVRMTGEAVACAWAVGWRGQPAPPRCAPVTIPPQTGETPGRAEVEVGELPPPERDDRYQVRWPNAPRDFMLLSRNDFDDPSGSPWNYTQRQGRFEIIQDSTAPDSPPNVGRAVFPAGFSGDGVEPFALDQPLFDDMAIRDLYIAFWLRVSENWQGHASGVNKILHIWSANGAVPGGNVATLVLMGVGRQQLRLQVNLQPSGFNRNLTANLSPGTIQRGSWVLVELAIDGSSGPNPDGASRTWLTGRSGRSTAVSSFRDVRYFDVAERLPFWSYVSWAPTWGGRGDRPLRETQTMDFDGILVMGR